MPTNVELSKMVEELTEQVKNLTSIINTTSTPQNSENQTVEDLKTQVKNLTAIINSNSLNTSKPEIRQEDEKIVVISNVLGKNGIQVGPGYDLIFYGFGDTKVFTVQEVRELLRAERVMSNFKKGLLTFEDSKWYNYFKISSPVLRTDEEIIAKINGSLPEFVGFLEQTTNYHKFADVEYTLFYRIVKLLKDGKIIIQEDKRTAIRDFFKLPIENAMVILSIIDA